MSKLLIVAGLLLAAGANAAQLKASSSTTTGGQWIDLFSAPYTSCPGVLMAISCMDSSSCYVPGGSSSGGFQLLQFDGKVNGTFAPMNTPDPMLIMLAIDVRGTKASPGGAVGGMGLQYLANTTTWLSSTIKGELIELTQDIRTAPDGKHVLAVDTSGTADVWFSTNGGKDFTTYNLNVPFITQDTDLRYGAIPTAETWYLSAGTWPSDSVKGTIHDSRNRKQAHSFALSSRVAAKRCPVTGKVSRVVRKIHQKRIAAPPAPLATNSSGYSAQIFKTADGGKTFKSVFASTTNFYFNAIDCLDVNTCYAVGEGMDANAGVWIYATKDAGATWNVVYSLLSTDEWTYSLMSIGVSADGTIIAAGGAEGSSSSQSLIITSTDGGASWTQATPLPNIVDIADLDVVAGGYAFAAAATIYDDSTILAFTP